MIAYTIVSIILLIASIALAATGYLWWAIGCGVVAVAFMIRSYIALQHSKSNLVTVLKAIKNSDHTFYFKDDSTGINQTLNQIKELIQATQKEVRDQELFLSSIIERVPTGVIISTKEGTIRFINHAALLFLGLPVISHLHRIRQVYPELYETLNEMKDDESRGVSIQTEKEIQQLSVERTTVELASGTACIITINDINSQLEQRETDSWISLIRVMTHEIMNSIAPIRSISEVLLDPNEEMDQSTRHAIETIHDTSDNLIRFVEDYRKFSSVPQPNPTILELKPLLEQATTLVCSSVQEKDIMLTISVNDEVVSADRNLLMQVIQNLLKNATEATPEGGKISMTYDVNSAGRPILKVFNTGHPVPEDIRQYIFIPFFTTKEGGSGIGLSLSRYIMRLHGGNLRYLPQANGSTFVIEF